MGILASVTTMRDDRILAAQSLHRIIGLTGKTPGGFFEKKVCSSRSALF